MDVTQAQRVTLSENFKNTHAISYMSIERFYTSSITVRRMVYTDDKSAITDVSTLIGHIQRANSDIVANFDSSLNISHVIWCSKDASVSIGDVLVSDGENYTVRRVQVEIVTPTGNNQHLQIYVEKSA